MRRGEEEHSMRRKCKYHVRIINTGRMAGIAAQPRARAFELGDEVRGADGGQTTQVSERCRCPRWEGEERPLGHWERHVWTWEEGGVEGCG